MAPANTHTRFERKTVFTLHTKARSRTTGTSEAHTRAGGTVGMLGRRRALLASRMGARMQGLKSPKE